MTSTELVEVVKKVEALLATHGFEDRAGWVAERAEILRSSESDEIATAKARQELHSIVLGMDGLFDLPLEPFGAVSAGEARATLDGLADQLYNLTE